MSFKVNSLLSAWFGVQEVFDTEFALKMVRSHARTGMASMMWGGSLKSESSPRPGARKAMGISVLHPQINLFCPKQEYTWKWIHS